MASFRIPRLVAKTNGAGLTSWYWQPSATLRAKGWHPRRLGSSNGPDAPDDVAAAARALNLQVDGATALPPRELRRAQQPLTLDQAVARWRDAGFPSVKKPGSKVAGSTARQYGSKCRTIAAWGKSVALTSITPERVGKLRDALMQPVPCEDAGGPRATVGVDGRATKVRHHAAHETLRVGRTLFSWLEQQRLVARGSNPFTGFALAAPDPRDAIWWAPHRDAILAAAATDSTAMELAVDLAFSIGQREADLLKLQIGQYAEIPRYKMDPEVWEQLAEATEGAPGLAGGGAPRKMVTGIRIRQGKGKVWIEVPIVGATRARVEAQVAAAKKAGVTSLLFDHATGLPWTQPNLEAGQRRFIRAFGDVRAQAIRRARVGEDGRAPDEQFARELEALQFRDFRRTAVVYLGELGIADQLIAAITGHSLDDTKKILDTYMPRTTGMAARAIALSQARGGEAAKQEQTNG